jgi:TIR domain/Effector-associated domain 2
MRRRTYEEIVNLRDALLTMDHMTVLQYRNFYVSELERRLGVSVERFNDALHDIWSTLRTCNDHDEGLASLADILKEGQPGSRSVEQFSSLLERQEHADSPWSAVVAPRESRGPGEREPARVFVSYSRDDDKATYGRISALVRDLDVMYRNATGQLARVFKDDVTIRPGENWRQAIDDGIASSVVLLAFVSPAFLRSQYCRTEVLDFLSATGPRLLLPLLYFERAKVSDQFASDPLWRRIDQIQQISIVTLRRADPGTEVWLTATEHIAARISEVLDTTASPLE